MKMNYDDPKWTAYVLGELDEVERAEVETLLESSAEARAFVEDLRMASTLLKDELTPMASASLRPDQRAAVQAAAGVTERRQSSIWRPAAWAVGLAAAVLIVVSLSVPSLLRSRQAAQPSLNQSAALSGSNESEVYPAIVQRVQPAPEPVSPGAVGGALPESIVEEQQPSLTTYDREIRTENKELSKVEVSGDTTRSQVLSAVITGGERQAEGQRAPGAADAALVPPVQPNVGGAANRVTNPFVGARSGGGVADGNVRVREQNAAPAAAPPPPPPRFGILPDRPSQPSFNTEAYDRITDNPFLRVAQNPLATFSIDVDTASYANTRRFLMQNQLPPRDSVRIEEMINYFTYNYPQPTGEHPIAAQMEVATAPWAPQHRLVRIGIKGKEMDASRRPSSNLVFLVDVSGSMQPAEKLPLLKSAMKLLVDKLSENDRVSIVVYAGASGVVLQPTTGDKKEVIINALERLQAGGSTNGASGIQLAYDLAVGNFIRGGVNRVVLATDGDFNVGVTNQGDLIRLIEDKAKSGVFLSVFGFGMGNLKDSTLEKLADSGNGNYAYIDTINEARKVLVEEMGGTLITIAKDVKMQIEFNPTQVSAYRLIGYENRLLRDEDFNNDLKDAGDMGSGHTVTALFEVVPPGVEVPIPGVDPLKYQEPAAAPVRVVSSREMLTLKIRYKDPDGTTSKLLDVPLSDRGGAFLNASQDFRFAASVAAFGMILRDSPYKGDVNLDTVMGMAQQSRGADRGGYREEFISLVRRARALRDLR